MMVETKNKPKIIMNLLFELINRGWWYYSCAKQLDSSFRQGKIASTYYFFLAAYSACLNETILNIAKIVISHRESITIHTLVRYANDHPEEFIHATKSELIQLAKMRKIRMRKFNSLLENIGYQRNKILAHLDMTIVENPQNIGSLPIIDMNEVERLYLVMLDILNGYSKNYDTSEYYMENLNQGVEEDIKFLLSRISKYKGS